MNIIHKKDYPNVNFNFIDKGLYNKTIKLKNKIERMSSKRWNKISKLCNDYEYVPILDNKKRISRAFYKLYEIHKLFNVIEDKDKITTCHICESPGGFIECVQDIRQYNKNDTLISQSLFDSECKFSKYIKDIAVITYGTDKTGNILHTCNIIDMINICNKYGKVDLVTCDGGVDVSCDYLKQEQLSFKLILSQIVTSLGCLKKGGNLVFKIFDIYTLPTVQLIYMLTIWFEDIFIYKPYMSRPCNSEKYIILKNFKDNIIHEVYLKLLYSINKENLSTFGFSMDESFVKQIKNVNDTYATKQISSFEKVFRFDKKHTNVDVRRDISIKYLKDIIFF